MKDTCQCQSETHGHKRGKCREPATEPGHMCKKCHDKAAKDMAELNQSSIQQPQRR
jgi:hypothetical protein